MGQQASANAALMRWCRRAQDFLKLRMRVRLGYKNTDMNNPDDDKSANALFQLHSAAAFELFPSSMRLQLISSVLEAPLNVRARA